MDRGCKNTFSYAIFQSSGDLAEDPATAKDVFGMIYDASKAVGATGKEDDKLSRITGAYSAKFMCMMSEIDGGLHSFVGILRNCHNSG